MSIIVTGGAGFIGSNFINNWIRISDEPIINIDKLTYSGNLNNFITPPDGKKHIFIKADIQDKEVLTNTLREFQPRRLINFAAETHVDRSIHEPEDFIMTNILGTFCLLECAKNYWFSLSKNQKSVFRFLHISTDEVFGSLKVNAPAFNETNSYNPNSPYSASKASADHIVRAYYQTYDFPALITNCSNNYGPYQFPEKLIPLIIHNALSLKALPIYGDGLQIRDWLYVEDHCNAIRTVIERGKCGEVYNIGGFNEKTNIEVVHAICDVLDELRPLTKKHKIKSYKNLISFIKDRPGHDRRYAIDATKIKVELGWSPLETFNNGIYKTVKWYLDNPNWLAQVINGDYQNWLKKQYL